MTKSRSAATACPTPPLPPSFSSDTITLFRWQIRNLCSKATKTCTEQCPEETSASPRNATKAFNQRLHKTCHKRQSRTRSRGHRQVPVDRQGLKLPTKPQLLYHRFPRLVSATDVAPTHETPHKHVAQRGTSVGSKARSEQSSICSLKTTRRCCTCIYVQKA
jgi:hypothetical protein